MNAKISGFDDLDLQNTCGGQRDTEVLTERRDVRIQTSCLLMRCSDDDIAKSVVRALLRVWSHSHKKAVSVLP